MSNVTLLPRPIHPDWKCIYYNTSWTVGYLYRIYIHDTNTDKVLVTITGNHNVLYQEYHPSKSDIVIDKNYTKLSSLVEDSVLLAEWVGHGYELTRYLMYVLDNSKYTTSPDYNILGVSNSKINFILRELIKVSSTRDYNNLREGHNVEDIKEAFAKLPLNIKPAIEEIIFEAKKIRAEINRIMNSERINWFSIV